MNAGRILTAATLALLLGAPIASGAPRSPNDRLRTLGNEYLARRLARAPHLATRLGDHAADQLLLPVTGVTPADELAWQRGFRTRLAAVRRDQLTREWAAERDLLAAAVERELLELEVIRSRERDPGAYLPLVAGAIESVLERGGASPCVRVRLATRRLTRVPEVLRAARLSLRNPPRVLTEEAIAGFAGVLRFYRETIPGLAVGCRNAQLQADLAQADTTAVRAVVEFLLYLREDLLPASHGELAIGPEGCRRLLRSALLAEPAPIETLQVWGERAVAERRAELEGLAPQVAAGGVRAALDSLAAEDPDEDGRVPDLERCLARVTGFLRERELVTLPSRAGLRVRAARPFRQVPGGVALEAPGPWESAATMAWLEVEPASPIAEAAPPRSATARWSRPEAELAVAHEGVPGRFLRAMALRGLSSRLRSALQSSWSGEDWGRYCETMMIEEGFGGDDPRYRFAAALRALRQAGCSYAALSLHAGAMSMDQVCLMLEERCLLDPQQAASEACWAAADPALMGYTLGARGLLELRDEARRTLGPRFRIRDFNDAVLRYGASPLGLVREGVRHEQGIIGVDTPLGAPSKP